MDRCAVFVDAGFALVAGNYICTGQPSRSHSRCRYEPFIRAISAYASDDCGFPVMRTYWYDAAPDAGPTPDHQKIAKLRDVKIRLGRLAGGRQKGVDALVYKDLITLSRERAIETAYLVSGDYDMREGMIAAQEVGVQVYLIGFETGNPTVASLAEPLLREADGYEELEEDFVRPYFEVPEAEEDRTPEEFGHQFARWWVEKADGEEIRGVVESKPRIPPSVDGHLLSKAETEFGDLRDREGVRRDLRAGFWDGVQETQG